MTNTNQVQTPAQHRARRAIFKSILGAPPATASKQPRKPAKARAPAMLFPDLPPTNVPDGIFWRAAFLRDLAIAHAGQALIEKTRTDDVTETFLYSSMRVQIDELKKSFRQWMDAIDGLAGDGVDGAANGVRQ